MTDETLAKIAQSGDYKELVRRTRAVTVPLTFLMLVAYFSFILLVAYAPAYLKTTIGTGVTTLGIAFGLGIIILTLIITVIYVRYANRNIETLVETIKHKGV